jgi:hypothetical protein
LFYEEIEGFGLVYALRRFDNFGNETCNWKVTKSAKPHDSVTLICF